MKFWQKILIRQLLSKAGQVVALKKVLMENEKEGFPITALRFVSNIFLLVFNKSFQSNHFQGDQNLAVAPAREHCQSHRDLQNKGLDLKSR